MNSELKLLILLEKAKKGDNNAFEELFKLLEPAIKSRSYDDFNNFNQDLYQHLSIILYLCIKQFKF